MLKDASKIFIITQQVKKYYEKSLLPVMTKYNLTKNQIDILLFLTNNPTFNTVGEIVEIRVLSKSQTSASIDEMCRRGIVTKMQAGSDKRSFKIHITPDVSELISEAVTAQANFGINIMDGLSSDDLAQFNIIMDKISANLTSKNL